MKKTITTITLAIVMTLGATFANAGILVSDRQATDCTITTSDKDGIIVFGRDGIIVFGIVIYQPTKPCTDADRAGILVGD